MLDQSGICKAVKSVDGYPEAMIILPYENKFEDKEVRAMIADFYDYLIRYGKIKLSD